VLQLDELYTRVRGSASARWLWLASDPVSKAIPSLHVGGRTKQDALALVHDLKSRLQPQHIPAFLTDGLRTYFYALTAHFGTWFRPPRARKDHWFRAYYHFVRPHQSLRLPVPGLKRHYRCRTPAMALGLTDRIWSVHDLLHYPVPQVA
jgi:hypothetical protein